MKQGQRVRLTKIEINNPETNYATGYWTEGILAFDVEIGKPLYMDRYRRARKFAHEPEVVDIHGIFNTSTIKEINGDLLKTQNSVWKIDVLV